MEQKIVFITTPKTCKACRHYNRRKKGCRLRLCAYPAKRWGGWC